MSAITKNILPSAIKKKPTKQINGETRVLLQSKAKFPFTSMELFLLQESKQKSYIGKQNEITRSRQY